MEIGIDDFIDDELIEENDTPIQDNQEEASNEERVYTDEEPDDFITSLLKSRGIEDKSRIKFENEDGETEEIDWNTLDNETRLNILNSSVKENDLDEAEIQLINSVRQSRLSPAEYLQYVQQDGINRYLLNNQEGYTFKVDELSDEELFVTDFMARTGATEEEAFEALDRSKANENLFNKLIGAMRSEYQKQETEALKYEEFRKQEEAQAQFNLFADGVKNEILDFTEFAGCDLNMNSEDMNELYDFITGFDTAGNSHFGKALNDPATLVRMAWFALNGEKMIEDINEYYKKEIASVSRKSLKDKPSVVYKKPLNTAQIFDDIDDF